MSRMTIEYQDADNPYLWHTLKVCCFKDEVDRWVENNRTASPHRYREWRVRDQHRTHEVSGLVVVWFKSPVFRVYQAYRAAGLIGPRA